MSTSLLRTFNLEVENYLFVFDKEKKRLNTSLWQIFGFSSFHGLISYNDYTMLLAFESLLWNQILT